MRLTHKQQIFTNEYLQCWNATEAARRAGYAFPNVEGPKNLVKPSIKKEISRRLDEMKMSADEALLLLANQARGSLGSFLSIGENGDFEIDLNNPNANLALIKKLKHTRKTYVDRKDEDKKEVVDHYELELYDAQSAISLIGKHHGIFAKDRKIEITWRHKLPEGEDPSEMVSQFQGLLHQKAKELEEAERDS